jgi:HlyD family secretion protein
VGGAVLTLCGFAASFVVLHSRPGPARAADEGAANVVLEVKGWIVPVRQIQVTPDVGGRVTELLIDEGKRVCRGEVLARLDDRVLQLDYKQAQARLDQARARYEELRSGSRPEARAEAKAGLDSARQQAERARTLLQRREKALAQGVDPAKEDLIVHQQALQRAESEVKRWQATFDRVMAGPRKEALEAARAGVAGAEAACAKARHLLDGATIRAPFDGTVVLKRVEVGSVVQPLGFQVPASICDLADLSELEVELWVAERDIGRLAPGQRARVRLEAHPERKYDGKVSRVLPVADRARGAIGVRVRFKVPANEEPGKYVRPEMGAVVSLLHKE